MITELYVWPTTIVWLKVSFELAEGFPLTFRVGLAPCQESDLEQIAVTWLILLSLPLF